jgi:dephospho-CoA kinase
MNEGAIVSKWPGKYVIGLTGNIGTGKSVVRRMLEHLGAYGIDADMLSHRAVAKGAPGYSPVVSTFGKYILAPDGEINRARLGRLVFGDPEAMDLLEKIIHPLVEQAIDVMVQRASQPVVTIEAIKLFEANLYRSCDGVWVTVAPPEVQLARLVQQRKMNEVEARQRIAGQAAQEKKISQATVAIKNVGSFEDTWKQVTAAWQKYVPAGSQTPVAAPVVKVKAPEGEISVQRGRPRHSNEIAELINRLRHPEVPLKKDDVMAAFGEKAFLLLQVGQTNVGVIGWQVENLVSRTTDIVIDPSVSMTQALPALITEMEKASKDLQCEASLIFAPPYLAKQEGLWRSLGYDRRSAESLGVLAWMEAALESMLPNTTMYFKQLRTDRILRPI